MPRARPRGVPPASAPAPVPVVEVEERMPTAAHGSPEGVAAQLIGLMCVPAAPCAPGRGPRQPTLSSVTVQSVQPVSDWADRVVAIGHAREDRRVGRELVDFSLGVPVVARSARTSSRRRSPPWSIAGGTSPPPAGRGSCRPAGWCSSWRASRRRRTTPVTRLTRSRRAARDEEQGRERDRSGDRQTAPQVHEYPLLRSRPTKAQVRRDSDRTGWRPGSARPTGHGNDTRRTVRPGPPPAPAPARRTGKGPPSCARS